MNRREFIKSVALATAGVEFLRVGSVIDPGGASAASASVAPSSLTPQPVGYFEGTVLSTSNSKLLISTPTQAAMQFVLPPIPDEVWRGGPASSADIEVGDFVRLTAVQQGTARAVSKIYANLVNLRGTISNSNVSSFDLIGLKNGVAYHIDLAPDTILDVQYVNQGLPDGEIAFLIAYRDPQNQSLRATWVDVVSTNNLSV